MITISPNEKSKDVNETNAKFYHWTELIQSSPEAIEEAVTSVIGGGYRKCNLVLQELRFNPMKRNRSGERDLDHIVMSAIWGLDRALLQYPRVKAGIILMMDREFDFKLNSIIIDKAIKYKKQGVVGIDLAGPQRKNFSMKKHLPLFVKARKAGLGITVHTGEEGNIEELRYVVKNIRPDRIGHGVMSVKDKNIMAAIKKNNIILEICPTSNLRNSVVKNLKEMKSIFDTLLKNKIKFTINTDGPEMYMTNIHKEQKFLIKNKILTQKQVLQCNKWAFDASFIK